MYTKYKATLPRIIGSAPEDGGESSAWNDEVEKKKRHFAGVFDKKEDIAWAYSNLREEKDGYADKAKALSVDVEALTRLLVERLEADGATGITLENGAKFDIDDKPHSSYEDPHAFIQWVKAEGMEDMLRMQWQTMNALVKQRLENGLEAPPGVKVHLRSSITRRKKK